MEIYGCSVTDYSDRYEERLNLYKDKFEDRDESIFLEREMINFKDFHNVLVSIFNCFIKNNDYHKLINDPQFINHLNHLQNNYNDVFKELFQIGPPLLDANKNVSNPDDIKNEDNRGYIFYFDFTKEKVDNLIVSTKRILKYLNNKKLRLQKPRTPESEEEYKGSITTKETKPPKPSKIPAKWHALAYLIELKSKGLKPPINTEGAFIKLELEAIGRIKTGLKGQGFYREVSKHYKDLDKPEILNKSFGKDWKDTILKLFNSNIVLKEYIDKHY
ncbi:hypothetical protein [Aestuariivivens sediminis]|uniref:hypothetical protein n=1 Tax=Aestuariivivens sediminis TaxID=2913557 RepID=UPI001F58A4DA|nr:hypothetical protein [Aestuariivivens sediminis]